MTVSLPSALRKSMRVRLMLLMIAIFVVAAAIAGYLINRSSLHELDEILNANLAQSTRAIYQVLKDDIEQGDRERLQKFVDSYSGLQGADDLQQRELYGENASERAEQLDYQRQIYIHVSNLDKNIDIHSRGQELDVSGSKSQGYFGVKEGGHLWHFNSVANGEGSIRLAMGQRADYRDEILEKLSETVFVPTLVVIPFLAYALWWGSGRGIKPLRMLSGEIGRRESDNLEPITDQYTVTETKPVVEALNALLGRLRKALANERRFTADASHELRTPIASIQVQLDVLQRARDDMEKKVAIDSMSKSTARMSFLVEELLALARLDGESAEPALTAFDLRELVMDSIAEMAFTALEKEIEISLDGESVLPVVSNSHMLRLVLSNLLTNAVKYTPSGGHVTVTVKRAAGLAGFWVEDSGPGIESAKLQRITERFYRVQGESRQQFAGAGLGLSIAARAAELLGANLEFSNRVQGGLSAELRLPASQTGDSPDSVRPSSSQG